MKYWLLILAFLSTPSLAATVAERLGLPADAKLLIVHADDIGLSHSVNLASFNAFTSGTVHSGSLMVPCAWFDEAAAAFHDDPSTLFATAEFFAAYVETGRKYRLPILIPRESLLAQSPELAQMLKPDEILVDRVFMADPTIALDEFDEYYTGRRQRSSGDLATAGQNIVSR